MPRDGALVLSDLRQPTLSIVCEPCGRRGRYSVAKLMEQHGDAKLTDLLLTPAACPKARSASIHDPCKAVYCQSATRRTGGAVVRRDAPTSRTAPGRRRATTSRRSAPSVAVRRLQFCLSDGLRNCAIRLAL
jgi:hypothetical protein